MALPSKFLEQIAFNTRLKKEEHMLVVMNKSTQEERLTQPFQTNIKQYKIAIPFLTGYNGIFNITNSNIKFPFQKTITNEEDFIQITIPPVAYEIESSNKENRRIIFDKGHYTEKEYPFTINPNFSTLGSIVEIKPRGAIIGFVFEDRISNLLGFHGTIIYKK